MLQENRYLFIHSKAGTLSDWETLRGNVKISEPLKQINIIGRAVRRLLYSFKCRPTYFYGDWKKIMDCFPVIVIYAQKNEDIISYLCSRKEENQRIIVWYWNPVSRCVNPNKIKGLGCELWSFDPEDCRKYGLNFNTTYYFKDLKLPVSFSKEYDVFFCGINKGRKNKLNEIQAILAKNSITSFFYLVDEELPVSERLPRLQYKEYLSKLSNANAILDILQDGQQGMTLRVMEALFFNKKLITNQSSIAKEDFYNSNNIFIIGKDDWNNIKDFMNKPVIKTPEEVLDKYDFFTWLKRFDQSSKR